SHPQEAETPTETIGRTIRWLGDRSGPPAGRRGRSPAQTDSVQLREGESTIRETLLSLQLAAGETFGILTEPVSEAPRPLTGVLLNGGALRHTGPNRSAVETARRWAARGVASVRFDLSGLGDAAGDERALVSNTALYARRSTDDVLGVVDQLAARGLPERFVLGGLCTAGYQSLHAALADPRIAGAALINLYAFYWSEALVAERETFRSRNMQRRPALLQMMRGRLTPENLMTALRSVQPNRIRRGGRHPSERAQRAAIARMLDRLRDQGTELLLLLSEEEPLYDQLRRQRHLAHLDRWPNLTVERIPSRDHMFRALWLQDRVHTHVDGLLDRVLARSTAAPG
ncbi:MAG TPA: hypothetical protein VGI87_17650, partial [Solirubrobacteraceae bacterium]